MNNEEILIHSASSPFVSREFGTGHGPPSSGHGPVETNCGVDKIDSM